MAMIGSVRLLRPRAFQTQLRRIVCLGSNCGLRQSVPGLGSSQMMSTEGRPRLQSLEHALKKIGTHSGTFHCDEALAVFLLRSTDTYHQAEVIRSRDPSVLDTCDIVVDVGGVYDATQNRFDHHQRGFEEVFGHGFTTKLSSAGLIYKHFGREIIANRYHLSTDDPKVQTLYLKLYKEFVEAIDGIDNGISQYPSGLSPRYRSRTDLSSRVGSLNPTWNESVDAQSMDTRFTQASALTGSELFGQLDYYAEAWLPAHEIVKEAVNTRASVDPSGKLMVFDRYVPWKEHLFELEPDSTTLFVIYPDESAGNWRVQAVPMDVDSFESRKALPEAWRGLRDRELSEKNGITGCIFVHASGFIGGNQTRDGAIAMGRASL